MMKLMVLMMIIMNLFVIGLPEESAFALNTARTTVRNPQCFKSLYAACVILIGLMSDTGMEVAMVKSKFVKKQSLIFMND